jgi:sugar lactone lactonase YvrE
MLLTYETIGQSYTTSLVAGRPTGFGRPRAIVADKNGNIFFTAQNDHKIWKVSPTGSLTKVAGSTRGFRNGPSSSAQFNNPVALAIDSQGNIYVSDSYNHRVRKVSVDGIVSTYAGNGVNALINNIDTLASFRGVAGIAFDKNHNLLVVDNGANVIRKVAANRMVTTFIGNPRGGIHADGIDSLATFNRPDGILVSSNGDIFVSETWGNRVRKRTTLGIVSTIAGNGTAGSNNGQGTLSRLSTPMGMAEDTSGNLYVADYNNHLIRKILPNGFVSTLAGSISGYIDSLGRNALFNGPSSLVFDQRNNSLIVADEYNGCLRVISANTRVRTMLGGSSRGNSNGYASYAQFQRPVGIATDNQGNLIVADYDANRLRKIDQNQNVSDFAGDGISGFLDGTLLGSRLSAPSDVTYDSRGNLFVADDFNHRIRYISRGSNRMTSVYYDTRGDCFAGFCINTPSSVAVDIFGNIYYGTLSSYIGRIRTNGVVDTLAGSSRSGNRDGSGNIAQFKQITAVTTDINGNVYVTDAGNHNIRKIDVNRQVTTIAGDGFPNYSDGVGENAQFNKPTGIVVDPFGNIIVADHENHCIRKIDGSRNVSTIVGSPYESGYVEGRGADALFISPQCLAIDQRGYIYVSDIGTRLIRKIIPPDIFLSARTSTKKVLRVIPSPNNGSFFIWGLNDISSIEIRSMQGSVVISKSNITSNDEIKTSLPRGLYVCAVTSTQGKTITRFIVE